MVHRADNFLAANFSKAKNTHFVQGAHKTNLTVGVYRFWRRYQILEGRRNFEIFDNQHIFPKSDKTWSRAHNSRWMAPDIHAITCIGARNLKNMRFH